MKKTNENQSEEEALFQKLEEASAVIWIDGVAGAKEAREVLGEQLWARREALLRKEKDPVPWIAYLLRLILTAPALLRRPAGFEWVTNDLEWGLSVHNAAFWFALDSVKKTLKKKGRPPEMEKDAYRYFTVHDLMEKKGISKEKAIGEAVQKEGGSMDVSRIRRSLTKFEKRMKRMQSTIKNLQKSRRKNID